MHIKPIKFLETDLFNIKYDLKKKLYKRYISVDGGDKNEIKEAIVPDNNKDDNKKDFLKK